jgi:hypothetical protein
MDTRGAPGEGVWLDPATWERHGRGRRWEFELATKDIIQTLVGVGEERNDTLELLSCSRIQVGRDWFSLYEPQPLTGLGSGGTWQYFVRSGLLTPAIPAPEPLSGVGWPAAFATNGLLVLHHPDPARRSAPDRSSIGIVNRVRNTVTDETLVHRGYDDMFQEVKRALQKL